MTPWLVFLVIVVVLLGALNVFLMFAVDETSAENERLRLLLDEDMRR